MEGEEQEAEGAMRGLEAHGKQGGVDRDGIEVADVD